MRKIPDMTRYLVTCEGCGKEFSVTATQKARGACLCSNACKSVRAERRMWEQIDATGICWEWTGGKTDGYGSVKRKGKSQRVHRVVWELLVGPIPEGMPLDHLCRNHACCNPDHLEPVTDRENALRGQAPGVRRYWENKRYQDSHAA